MSKITIVANIIVKEEHIELVKVELLKIVEISRKEQGCINYDLHRDNDNSSHFMFYENWETRDLWQAHTQNKHIIDYRAATKDAIESFSVNEMTQVG